MDSEQKVTPTPDDVIREAYTWIHTPFRTQGRIKGKAGDCVAIVIGIAHALRLSDFDYTGYGVHPVPEEMGRILDQHLDRVPKSERRPGDILWLRDPSDRNSKPGHLAIYTEKATVIHLSSQVKNGKELGRCVEHRLSEKWERAIFRVYRYRGLED